MNRIRMRRFAKVLAVLFVFSFSVTAQSQQSLDDQVKPIVASFKGKVSLFAKNLDTGETYALNRGRTCAHCKHDQDRRHDRGVCARD